MSFFYHNILYTINENIGKLNMILQRTNSMYLQMWKVLPEMKEPHNFKTEMHHSSECTYPIKIKCCGQMTPIFNLLAIWHIKCVPHVGVSDLVKRSYDDKLRNKI